MFRYLFNYAIFLTALINLIKSSNQIQQSYYNSNENDLKVEYCDNCQIFIGGLFPVHAPKSRLNTNYPQNSNIIRNNDNIHANGHSLLVKASLSATAKPTTTNYTVVNVVDEFLYKSNCGEIKKERGIQRLEAMLYAIDLINNSTNVLPYIKLGAKIYDTCDRDTIALEKCMNFISDHFLLQNDNVVNDFVCEAHRGLSSLMTPVRNSELIYRRKVVGVIGAASSSVSVQVASILRLFEIPQISYASTSPELSNRERFPYFSRVLPSDTLQAEAMAILVKSLNWNYVATLSEEGNLGGIDAFVVNAKHERICISGSYTLSQTASENDVSRIVLEMYKEKTSRAVVMFLQDHNIKKVLSAVQNLGLSRHFLFVASDSWGTKKDFIESYNLVAESTITFAPKSYDVRGFNEYFKQLNPKTNMRNPWFKEFWEGQFNCTMNETLSELLNKRLCTGEEQLDVAPDGFIHFVIDSVFAMAHAIQAIINRNCPNMTTAKELIKCKDLAPIQGAKLLKEIRNVEFDSITGRRVKFLKEKNNLGDGIIQFEVFQYQRYDNGRYHYQKIAEWDSEKEILTIEKSKLKWRDGTNEIPKSICKEECGLGEIKQGDTCCWVCVKCDETEYSTPNKTKCVKCPLGYGPNDNKTACQKLPIEYMDFNNGFTIVSVIVASIGILFTCYCIAVFLKYSETPIIKASGRELCYVLLAGIMSCYLMTFPLVTKPTVISCLMLKIGVSLSLTVCLSALFTKTNRLSRIFNSSVKKVKQASYVSPKSQLVICFSIISIQVIGVLAWLVISPPGLKLDYDDPKRVVLQCKTQNTHLVISFVYNLILVILCTLYAIKTRKIPENFNEARFIGFTMYAICLIWIAFIPIYFVSGATSTGRSYRNNFKIQLTALALCLSASATVIHACLFLPKLKIVVLKPNKNVRVKTGNVVKSIYSTTVKKNSLETSMNNNNLSNNCTNNKDLYSKQIVSVSSNSIQKTVVLDKKQKPNKFFAIFWPNRKAKHVTNEHNRPSIHQLLQNKKSISEAATTDKSFLRSDITKKLSTTATSNNHSITSTQTTKKCSITIMEFGKPSTNVNESTNAVDGSTEPLLYQNRNSIKLIDSFEDEFNSNPTTEFNRPADQLQPSDEQQVIENTHTSGDVALKETDLVGSKYCIANGDTRNGDETKALKNDTELQYFNEYTIMSLSPWIQKKTFLNNTEKVDSSDDSDDKTNAVVVNNTPITIDAPNIDLAIVDPDPELATRTVLFSSTDDLSDSYKMRITFV